MAPLLIVDPRMGAAPYLLALSLVHPAIVRAQTAAQPDPVVPVVPAVDVVEQAPAVPAGQNQPSDHKTAEEKKPPTPPHTGIRALAESVVEDITHLPSVENGFVALAGGGLAVGAHPFDQTFNRRLRSHYDVVNMAFAPAKYLGNTPEQVGLSVGTYLAGRIFDKPKIAHLGMDLLRAQILTEILVEPIKFATHRERPDQTNHQSFPSGHAAVTFAGATVLERHVGWKRSALAYAAATYVAMSRLHDNRHYLSDVAFGAAAGTIAGRTVTQHGRDSWTLTPVGVRGGGMAILVTRAPQGD